MSGIESLWNASSPSAYDLAMADRRPRISEALAPDEREEITRIAASHGARNVRLFGSVGRGESNSSSDLDLLVDMSGGRSLLDLVALGHEMEEALGLEVDVFTERSLSPYLRDRIVGRGASALRDERVKRSARSENLPSWLAI
jgi:predicted nucleotidyltransferase